MDLLRADGLEKRFGRKSIFTGVSLLLPEGRITGLVGENGSGKSTLLRCLLGIEPLQSGSVSLSERPGYCPQENYLNPRYTVAEHLRLAMCCYSAFRPARADFVHSLLERFGLAACLKERIGILSGGTYQKVKFVCSILHQPRLLLLDEPYDGFDWRMYRAFWDTLGLLRAGGTAILLVTHMVLDRQPFDAISSLEGGTLVAGS
jgi:ABC-type multidrug transport system ATPase subunit